jgi:aryl-alcohol dehydrogenase-like predicted oxidoreductase
MRLAGAGDVAAAAGLIRHAASLGISSFHCSSEYESFPLFKEAWRQAALPRRDVQIIAKVASPHFGEDRFSADAFRAKVDAYLRALAAERLDVVQWLLRFDLKQEGARLRILHDSTDELGATVEALKREGKIGSLVGFPYTSGVAEALIEAPYCDGLALYVNPIERDMDPFVHACSEAGKSVIAIRPYAAGRLFTETQLTSGDALRHVFSLPAVVTAVISASSREHLEAVRPYSGADAEAGACVAL